VVGSCFINLIDFLAGHAALNNAALAFMINVTLLTIKTTLQCEDVAQENSLEFVWQRFAHDCHLLYERPYKAEGAQGGDDPSNHNHYQSLITVSWPINPGVKKRYTKSNKNE